MASGAAVGMIGGNGFLGSSSNSLFQIKSRKKKNNIGRDRVKMICAASSVMDSYNTLRIQPGASQSEVRKAYRQLALQYHPDVCKGNNCGVQFSMINKAYDIVMSNLRGEESQRLMAYEESEEEGMSGMYDQDWDMWEEWMGYEGGPIPTYSSHFNPYF